jgi:predicted secreted acid phosphatase
MSIKNITISLDFDGVIHQYSEGWKDGSCYDNPMAGAFDFIKKQMQSGNKVFILSTRTPKQIVKWLKKQKAPFKFRKVRKKERNFWNELNVVGVTNRKLAAHIYIDDRGFLFQNNNWNEAAEKIAQLTT